MNYRQIIEAFAEWYCPACGAVDYALIGFIAKHTEAPKPWEIATAHRIMNYAERHGQNITDCVC